MTTTIKLAIAGALVLIYVTSCTFWLTSGMLAVSCHRGGFMVDPDELNCSARWVHP